MTTADEIMKRNTYKILHGCFARLIDAFEVFQDVVSVAVNHSNPDFFVVLILDMSSGKPSFICKEYKRKANRIRVFTDYRGPSGQDVGRIKFRVHRGGLASVDHEEDFMISTQRQLKLTRNSPVQNSGYLLTVSSATFVRRHPQDQRR